MAGRAGAIVPKPRSGPRGDVLNDGQRLLLDAAKVIAPP